VTGSVISAICVSCLKSNSTPRPRPLINPRIRSERLDIPAEVAGFPTLYSYPRQCGAHLARKKEVKKKKKKKNEEEEEEEEEDRPPDRQILRASYSFLASRITLFTRWLPGVPAISVKDAGQSAARPGVAHIFSGNLRMLHFLQFWERAFPSYHLCAHFLRFGGQ
jgi:hypothetical protein